MSIYTRIKSAITGHTGDNPEKATIKPTGADTRDGVVVDRDSYLNRLYNELYVSPALVAAIREVRLMDKLDPRVKKIHKRMARDATKGGIVIQWEGEENSKIKELFFHFINRLQLNNSQKLHSDARGALIEGTLAMQWVVSDQLKLVKALRMPAETIVPDTDPTGQFKNVSSAFKQLDPVGGYSVIAEFAFWQLSLCRLDPDNYDDLGSPGRPYLDATRTPWKQLNMTEKDLVIRRRTRAPQRFSHILEGAEATELEAYKQEVEADKHQITTDFYSNRSGGVTALAGDAALGEIADVVHLLDTFFAGSPGSKGLFGYSDGLSRDILEDITKDYYEEIDGLQDTLSQCYYEGFRLECLLHGINPDAFKFTIRFRERKTESRNQKADLALKYQALGMGNTISWETAGVETEYVKSKIKEESKNRQAYGLEDDDDPEAPKNNGEDPKRKGVTITPGNAPKSESATSIKNNA
jgi:hypothetical protein